MRERPLTGTESHPEALSRHDPVWTAPVLQRREGLPLGNGQMGTVVWGRGPLTFSLMGPRTVVPQAWGDVELIPKGVLREATMRLRLIDATAEGRLVTGQGAIGWTAWIHAEEPLLVIEVCAENEERGAVFRLLEARQLWPEVARMRARLDYPPVETGVSGEARWLRQRIPVGGQYAIAWQTRQAAVGRHQILWLSLVQEDGGDVLAAALELVRAASETGLAGLRAAHEGWWKTHYEAALAAAANRRLEGPDWLSVYYRGAVWRPNRPLLELPGPQKEAPDRSW